MTEVIGLAAAVLTTGSFIPQVIQIFKTRDVSSVITSYSIYYTKLYEAGSHCLSLA